jgi:hypothetical protein
MIVLCPNHHERADMREYPREYLYECKRRPHNVSVVADAFFTGAQRLTVSIASNRFTNISRILTVDDFDIISVTKEGSCPLLNVNFFDERGNWPAIIEQNHWYVDRRLVWDVEYRPRHLILRLSPRRISLDVEIVNDVVFVKGDLYHNGYRIEATQNDMYLGGRAIQMRGCVAESEDFSETANGLSISTRHR